MPWLWILALHAMLCAVFFFFLRALADGLFPGARQDNVRLAARFFQVAVFFDMAVAVVSCAAYP
jgi:hypothetical protein